MHNPNKNICIAGIGNTLRSDDSVGIYICNWLKKHEAPATILTTHQLDITMAETLSLFDVVIFIDAAVNESSWSFTLLENDPGQLSSSLHGISAAMLAALTKQLFTTGTQFYVCAVGATHFEMGSHLSEKTKQHALEAAALLLKWIKANR